MVKISISMILGRICADSVILSEWFGFHYRRRFGLSFWVRLWRRWLCARAVVIDIGCVGCCHGVDFIMQFHNLWGKTQSLQCFYMFGCAWLSVGVSLYWWLIGIFEAHGLKKLRHLVTAHCMSIIQAKCSMISFFLCFATELWCVCSIWFSTP
jgi:hypothetical protein